MNGRATAEEVVESEPYEIRIRLKPDPEDAELYGTMLTMLAELARARRYVERCQWRVPHPVKTRYCVKALRQVERQIAAEFERLYDGPVEIDPPPIQSTEAPASQPAPKQEEAMGTTTEEKVNTVNAEPGKIRAAADKAWKVAKKPKVWGTALALAGIGVVYLIVRAVSGDGPAVVAAAPSSPDPSAPSAPVNGGEATAPSTTEAPVANG